MRKYSINKKPLLKPSQQKKEKRMPQKKVRYILGLSGGKDSAVLALYLRDRIPDIEYFFCDTGCELLETYEFINKLEARLHKTIKILKSRFRVREKITLQC
ncbi:hypothetical protein BMS3Abin06_02749 [bacterium BMS3Abin06]|nr:hypothetical protein BMS3Abin06_02749 [bacterium BMS3Abin06]